MNQKQNYRGFFFALLWGILAISGVSAQEEPLFSASEEEVFVPESLESADEAPLWGIQEAISEFSLPEYSENQFFQGFLLFRRSVVFPENDQTASSSALGYGRDLRAAISIQIFPFHFFL